MGGGVCGVGIDGFPRVLGRGPWPVGGRIGYASGRRCVLVSEAVTDSELPRGASNTRSNATVSLWWAIGSRLGGDVVSG